MPYSKAIAAFIVPLVVGILAPLGISGETSVSEALTIGVTALLTAIAVYIVPNVTK